MSNISEELDYETGVCVTYQHDLDKIAYRKKRKEKIAEQKRRKEIHDRIKNSWMPSPYMEVNNGHLIHRGLGGTASFLKKEGNRRVRRNVQKIKDQMSYEDIANILEDDDWDLMMLSHPKDDMMLYQHNEYQKSFERDYVIMY